MRTRSLILIGLLVSAGSASAQSGLISFNGQVVNYTCVVSADGNANSADATIKLPTVAGASLSAAGSRAGMRRFDIVVGTPAQPCAARSVRTQWVGNGADVDPDNGRLSNRAGPGMASGVQVVVMNDNQQDIDLRNSANSQEVAFTNGVAILQYHGEYYGLGNLAEGMVSTSAQYELDYR